MIHSVMPDKFKLVNEDSNGYKFVNLLHGVEIDILYDYLDEAKHSNNLALFDYSTDHDIYEVIIRDNIINNEVNGDGHTVKITNGYEFYKGDPTRIEYAGNLTISGISYGIVGLEYLRTAPQGSGIIILNLDVDASTAFENNTYQTYKVTSDTLGNFDSANPSGLNLPVRFQSYSEVGIDEILIPEDYTTLSNEYPWTRMIKAPREGDTNVGNEVYYIDHYTPNNGYYWDSTDNCYKAIGYDSDFYYNINSQKIYYRTAFNNPYGTGVYDTTYIPLAHTPISGTLQVYDIDILTINNAPTLVPCSGLQSYYHSGVYEGKVSATYIGYESGVPHEYMPYEQTGWVPAEDYKVTTWDYCRESGELNDKFDWVEYPTNRLTNKIKIVNPISRYLVTYNYTTHKRNKYISTTSATKHIKNDNNNYLFTTLGNEDNEVIVEAELSKGTRSDKKAITFKGREIRPGSVINRLEIEEDVSLLNKEFKDSNNTLHLEKNTAGYTQTLLPNKIDHRVYYINSNFDDNSNDFSLVNEYSEAYLCNYDHYFGTRMVYTSGNLYYNYSGFIDLETSSADSNRYVKAEFKYNNIPSSNIVIAKATNESGLFWELYIDTDGYIKLNDQDTSLKTHDKVPTNSLPKSVILERNMLYNSDEQDLEYNIFYKGENMPYRQMDYFRGYVSNEIPSGDYTRAFINSNVDVKLIQVYEEPREFTSV